jgi:hypothetical protein
MNMAVAQLPVRPHWNYFLALDSDLSRLSRYVEFHPDNYGCFSLEIARVQLAAASEVDVVAKLLCKKINPKSKAEKIDQYRAEVLATFPQIAQFEVVAERFGLTMRPWREWAEGKSPLWWTAYNDVKHQRDTHFKKASLENMLHAVAGLFVVCLYFYKEEAEAPALSPRPEVLGATSKHLVGFAPTAVDVYRLD